MLRLKHQKYIKKIQIEARVLGDLAINHIVPTAINYQTMLIENVKGLKLIFSDGEFNDLAGARKDLIKEISNHISNIKSKTKDMIDARKVANVIDNTREKALAYEQNVKPYLEDIRTHIDRLVLWSIMSCGHCQNTASSYLHARVYSFIQ